MLQNGEFSKAKETIFAPFVSFSYISFASFSWWKYRVGLQGNLKFTIAPFCCPVLLVFGHPLKTCKATSIHIRAQKQASSLLFGLCRDEMQSTHWCLAGCKCFVLGWGLRASLSFILSIFKGFWQGKVKLCHSLLPGAMRSCFSMHKVCECPGRWYTIHLLGGIVSDFSPSEKDY